MVARTRPLFTVEIKRRRGPTPVSAGRHSLSASLWPKAGPLAPAQGELGTAAQSSLRAAGGGSLGLEATPALPRAGRQTGRVLPSLLGLEQARSEPKVVASALASQVAAGAGTPEDESPSNSVLPSRKRSSPRRTRKQQGDVSSGPMPVSADLSPPPLSGAEANDATAPRAAGESTANRQQVRSLADRRAKRRAGAEFRPGERWKRRLPGVLR